MVTKTIYCTGCETEVEARLTDGTERYPHRPDLAELPFWHCDTCGAWVGCHHKTTNRTLPLGYLATPEILKARIKIHDLLDPLWKSGMIKRGQAYAHIAKRLGYQYHTGEIKSLEEARTVYQIVADLHNQLLKESL
ncbi:MAG: hypothetical protein KGZ81_07260 [Flavobacteriales bacterium]|nr:hypothetical protein [Flavobacteriales bacterium]